MFCWEAETNESELLKNIDDMLDLGNIDQITHIHRSERNSDEILGTDLGRGSLMKSKMIQHIINVTSSIKFNQNYMRMTVLA